MYKKIFAVSIILQIFACQLFSSDSLKKSQTITSKTNKVIQKNQLEINKLDDKNEMMLAQYEVALKELDNYSIYNKQLQEIVTSQKKEIASIDKQNLEIRITKRRIMPMMQKMITVLEEFIKKDRPFLLDERKQRIDSLKNNMKRGDLSISSKYRQILESYQIEIDYGQTIESYKGKVEEKLVNFLKVGRVGLYYQTRDKSETAVWNMQKKVWQVLEDMDYHIAISKGIKIASKKRSPEMFFIAVEQEKEHK